MSTNVFTQSPIYKVLNRQKTASVTKSLRLDEVRAVNSSDLEDFGQLLRKAIGRQGEPFSKKLGTHPEFLHLKPAESRVFPIASVFIDIKGSTKLYRDFPYEEAYDKCQAIMESAIHIIQAFDGHVVRQPGDGIFATFGRSTEKTANALVDALNASSTLLWFLETFLAQQFKDNNLEPLQIRVGIDMDEKALWKRSRHSEVIEVSPNGYHVSLASKLQSEASVNSIMIGDNVKEFLQLPDEFYDFKTFIKDGDTKNDPYIDDTYRMWKFLWQKHIEKLSWVKNEDGARLPTVASSPFSIQLTATNPKDGSSKKILSSMEVLDKGLDLRFTVGPLPQGCRIRWFVENRGREATEADQKSTTRDLLFYEVVDSRDKTYTDNYTEYWGHHYMICEVTYPHIGKRTQKFGVFIGKDECTSQKTVQVYKQPLTIDATAHRL